MTTTGDGALRRLFCNPGDNSWTEIVARNRDHWLAIEFDVASTPEEWERRKREERTDG